MVQRDATFKIPVPRIWSGGWRLRNHPKKNWFEWAFKTCTSAASSWIKNFKDQQINSNNTSAPGLLKWNGCPRLVVDEGILMTVNLFGRHPTWIATKCDQQKYPWLHIGFNVFGLMNSLLCLVWHISWLAPPFSFVQNSQGFLYEVNPDFTKTHSSEQSRHFGFSCYQNSPEKEQKLQDIVQVSGDFNERTSFSWDESSP